MSKTASGWERYGSRISGGWRGFVGYFEGVMGADAYRRYLEHQQRTHPDAEPLGERAFWRDHMDWQDKNPQGRCC
ncbi:YbdD/YjiX family protein [Paeniglutamicibacter cryotolerans]|uniref:Uncharacterized short protein YbdD (DUF466 family) n=1 Tax=Paeniglutamicibacter cryotolerans TaxID=670079 RepID=A0A839QI92_9MICC|nr:YbdD/YjiX family protein [Paeniglutamicibacter cryotolerans]MBB2995333.1 uncharacterized short protein YbdD (DUF466 family) [Paeniglutamicibacter cryotolerans]